MNKTSKVKQVFIRALNQVDKGRTILFVGPCKERYLEIKNMVSFKSVADIIYTGFNKKEIEELWNQFQNTDHFIKMTHRPEHFLETEFYFYIGGVKKK